MSEKKRPYDDDPGTAKCKSCGVPYTEHLGLQGTCARSQAALSALRVIRTWATFEDGVALVPEHVKNLCDKTLKGTP